VNANARPTLSMPRDERVPSDPPTPREAVVPSTGLQRRQVARIHTRPPCRSLTACYHPRPTYLRHKWPLPTLVASTIHLLRLPPTCFKNQLRLIPNRLDRPSRPQPSAGWGHPEGPCCRRPQYQLRVTTAHCCAPLPESVLANTAGPALSPT
jgi:hypothetical protein